MRVNIRLKLNNFNMLSTLVCTAYSIVRGMFSVNKRHDLPGFLDGLILSSEGREGLELKGFQAPVFVV
jgi:hypothetical protein